MADNTTTWFNLPFGVRVSNQNPVDGDRYLVADLAGRDDLIGTRSYTGLQVYQQDTNILYLLILDTGTAGTSIWVELTRSDSNQGATGVRTMQFAADAADGSFSDLENLASSNSKWIFDAATGSVILTDSGDTLLPVTIPTNAFITTRNVYGMRTSNDEASFSYNFTKSRGTGNELETGDILGVISWHGQKAIDLDRISTEVIVILADQTGHDESFSHKADYIIKTSDNTEQSPTDSYRFLWDGTMQLLKVSTASGGDNVLAIDSSGNIFKSTKLESDIGAGAGAITSAITSVNGSNTSGTENLQIIGGTAINVVFFDGSGTKDITVNVVETSINHDNLFGFVPDEHINHTNVSVSTDFGSGLTGGGTIDASIAISLLASDSRNVAHNSVSISTGEGLSGGGTIAASRTHRLDFGGMSASIPAPNDVFAFSIGGGVNHRRATISQLLFDAFWIDSTVLTHGSHVGNITFRKGANNVIHYTGRFVWGASGPVELNIGDLAIWGPIASTNNTTMNASVFVTSTGQLNENFYAQDFIDQSGGTLARVFLYAANGWTTVYSGSYLGRGAEV